MVLHGKDRAILEREPGECAIVQIDVRALAADIVQGFRINRKAMVLAGDLYSS